MGHVSGPLPTPAWLEGSIVAMTCPHCKHSRTRVIDTRGQPNNTTYRRRECLKCGERFSTHEIASVKLTRLRSVADAVEDLTRIAGGTIKP